MGREQNKKGLDKINRNHDEKQNITEKEWALLENIEIFVRKIN